MQSRALRLTLGAVAWLAIIGAAAFLYQSEKQSALGRSAVRAFDLHAREATDALSDLRAGQQAYVAAGQGVAFWMPKVAATLDTITTSIAGLREAATSAAAKTSLNEAATTVGEFANIDKRARDYLKSGEQLMAADVIYTEGGETAANAGRQIEAARLAERQALDAAVAGRDRLEAMAGGAAALLAALIIVLLVPAPRRSEVAGEASGETVAPIVTSAAPLTMTLDDDDLNLRESQVAAAPRVEPASHPQSSAASARGISPVLKTAAQLCTDFGRASSVNDLTALLGRAADVMDASGMIVWLGSASGADLRPALAHGYTPQMLARIPPVPRSANNAAAAAYRTGAPQIVAGRPGANGAVVAPLIAAEGCVGALTAEIRGGGETSDSVQALAAIFAAHLVGVLATAPAAAEATGT